MSELTQ